MREQRLVRDLVAIAFALHGVHPRRSFLSVSQKGGGVATTTSNNVIASPIVANTTLHPQLPCDVMNVPSGRISLGFRRLTSLVKGKMAGPIEDIHLTFDGRFKIDRF